MITMYQYQQLQYNEREINMKFVLQVYTDDDKLYSSFTTFDPVSLQQLVAIYVEDEDETKEDDHDNSI